MRAMKPLCVSASRPLLFFSFFCTLLTIIFAHASTAQSVPYERSFPQSRAILEKRIKELQFSAGRLPVLDGFIVPGDRPLNRFQRAYFQCVTQVVSTPSGGSLVRVNATVTAWYTDPVAEKSGYQVLPSNGRLESDFLDRLQEELGGAPANARASASPPQPAKKPNTPGPTISAPGPGDPTPIVQSITSTGPTGSRFNLKDPLDAGQLASLATQKAIVDKHTQEQEKEAAALEEILHKQAHPSNLAAVKKPETPVLMSPNQGAKVLFLATAEDEFEILDSNPNWVHVRISGLSRGWIRRSSLEMPGPQSDAPAQENQNGTETHSQTAATVEQPFHVQSAQIASFPGNWEPLRGKTVSIISVQKTSDSATDGGPTAKLAFAKTLFDKAYADVSKGSTSIDGVVVIFDSEDGGMTAATVLALRQWKTGTLSEEAFWRRCFFDPPEAFASVSNP
jgi:hypothetical protein